MDLWHNLKIFYDGTWRPYWVAFDLFITIYILWNLHKLKVTLDENKKQLKDNKPK